MQQFEKENSILNLSNLNAQASTNVTMGGPSQNYDDSKSMMS